MRRIRAAVPLALFVVVATAGCLDPFTPYVPVAVLDASDHDWRGGDPQRTDGGFLGLDRVEVEYRFDPIGGPPFPGILAVVGLRGISRVDDGDLLDRTREFVESMLEDEGVNVDPQGELEGTRTLHNGASTQWFRLVGTSQATSRIFTVEEEVRVLGETWYDGRSSTNFIVVALAQTTGPGGLLGQTTVRDHAVWDELVGDPQGTVGNSIHGAGFVYNLVTHG